jgi:hypothetical protein
MKKDGLIRTIMLLAGFIAVAGILGSQSLYNNGLAGSGMKSSTEQAEKQVTAIQAPTDAIPGHAVQLDDSSVFHFIATIFDPEDEPELPQVPVERIGHFFEVLFRTLIAPNAP